MTALPSSLPSGPASESDTGLSASRGVWLIIGIALGAACLCASWLTSPLVVLGAVCVVAGGAVILRFPITGLCAAAFSIPWASGISLPLGGGITASPTEFVVAAIAVPLALALAAEPVLVRRAPWLGWIALFVLAITLSLTQALDTHAAVREIVKWIEMGVLYLAGCVFVRSRRELLMVAAVFVAAGVSEAILGYLQVALQAGPAAFASSRLALRAYGTFDQPNPYAGFLNMVLPLALGCALCIREARLRRWAWIATVLLAGAVAVSESRGAALAGVAAIGIVLGMSSAFWRRTVWLGVLGGLTVAWAATFGVVPQGPVDKVLNAVGLGNVSFNNVTDANFSAVERAAHWVAGIRMFEAHPLLGIGIGNYAVAYPAFHPRGWYASLEHAHNYYINIAAESGIIGLTFYLLMVGSALWYSCAVVRRARDPVYRAAALGAVGALVATSLHNVFDVLYVHGMAALLGLLLALLSPALRIRGSRAPSYTSAGANE